LGAYPDSMRADLRALYGKHGGSPEQLEFQPHLSDEALHRIYRQGLATVVPSRAEGFSIPILESIAAGTPVLASDAGAHPELVRDPAWRFDPDQPDQLRYLLERLLLEEQAWTAVRDFQAPVWREYTVDRVGENFVHCVLARCPDPHSAPAVKRGARPSIAVLTPLPPANSGVADYSAVTLRPLKVSADLHMFTPTRNAGWENGWASLGPVSAAKCSPRLFDATISVIGNSDHHTEIFDYVLNYGGACLAHDARQIDFYVHEKGMARALEVASAEYGQRVSEAQLQHWLQCQGDLPVLFLSELAKASSPLLVHSPVTADMIKDLYKVKPRVLPFAQYRILPSDMGTESARRRARDRLGIREGMIVLTTFGYVHSDKGAEDLVWTLKMLRNWGIDVQLVFCGTGHVDILAQIVALARSLDLVDRVVTFSDKVSESTYVEYLAASDAGVQLRRYFMGGLSGALNDCIAAGIPSIANEHLATAMVAPTYVRRVPDNLSSVLIAEAVLEILSTGENLKRPLDEMQAFRAKHSPEVYSEAILEALSIDLSSY
jgi:glycosyltransferase involved in cell wall biosynthesis